MKYDLLKEPWIPVVTMDNQTLRVGIYELISGAHMLKEVAEPSPMKEYGIYRMLCAFVMDAYRIQDEYEYRDMLDEGHFDTNVLDDYIGQCETEGTSFDLFDEMHPFMQSPYDEKIDKESNIKPVAAMDYSLPSGNNHIHFDHTLEKDSIMTADEAARTLMAVNVFCTAAAQGYPSTINGAPPLYCIIKGKNLFETLAFSVTTENRSELEYDNPKVFWRENKKVIPKEKVAITSVLYGMTFPCRRVRLIPETDGNSICVRNVFFQQGMDYVAYDAWNDPHVAYMYNDKGRISIKASLDKEPWRDISNLIKLEKGAPLIVKQYLDIFEDKNITLITYPVAIVPGQASYLSMSKSEMGLPVKIVKSNIKSNIIDNAIKFSDQVAKQMRDLLKQVPENEDSSSQILSQAVFKFYAIAKMLFFKRLCPSLEEADVNDTEAISNIIKDWHNEIQKQAVDVFDKAADKFGTSGRILLNIERSKLFFRTSINKLRKEEEK